MSEEQGRWTRVKQPARLPNVELALYYVLWATLMACSYYNIYKYSSEHREDFPEFSLEEGWSILGGKKDAKDFELLYWKQLMHQAWPWLVGHVVLGLSCRHLALRKRQQLMVFFDILALCWLLTPQAVLFVTIFVLVLTSFAILTRSLLAVWLLLLTSIQVLQWEAKFPGSAMSTFVGDHLCNRDHQIRQMFRYSSYFGFLKVASFLHHLIDQLNEPSEQSAEILNKVNGASQTNQTDQTQKVEKPFKVTPLGVMHYTFYLPSYFLGPLFIFNRFNSQSKNFVLPWTSNRIRALLWDTFRILFWALVLEIVYHLIFFYSIQFDEDIVQELTYWELAGLICTIVPFFYLKYLVIYGVGGNIARWEHITPPHTPVCVVSTYTYSEDWRLFDVGLYEFLMRHIYFPLGGSRRGPVRQVLAAVACFSFTCFWHGALDYLLVWTAFNVSIVGVEVVANNVVHIERYKKFEKYLSPAMVRRLSTLFWVPMRLLHTMATLIFIGGGRPAYLFIQRMFVEGFPAATVSIFLAYYLFVQVGMEGHRRRHDRLKKETKQKTL